MYPVLQAQEKEPAVLVHVASEWQLCVPAVHSLSSEEIEKENKTSMVCGMVINCDFTHQ